MDRAPDPGAAAPAPSAVLPAWLAVALVAGSSAAVLVLEILAGRLLAPYVGVSLETYTGIIGTVLAGIAAGAWAGGAMADRTDPRRLLPLLLLVGGALAIASIPVVRGLGGAEASSGARIVLLATVGFLPSAAVLSAVPPVVVKLQLRDLAATGTTVGRLSAAGTAGAIVGTFVTGFVLVAWAAVTTLIVAVGIVVVAAGALLWLATPNRSVPAMAGAAGLAALSLVGVAATSAPCEVQTRYYCASLLGDPDRPSGRTLVLDDLRHSYVDLADPQHLEFWYVRRLVDGIEAYAPAGPLDVVHLGGGGLTVPRYLQDTRPTSRQTVLEIDGELVALVRSSLPFPTEGIEVVVGDGRRSMADLPSGGADVVVGDAFASRAVPWHLTTEEFVGEVSRVLRPGGLYLLNVIDGGSLDYLRAQAATVRRVLPHVAVVLGPGAARGESSNSVIVASDRPVDPGALDARRRAAGDGGQVVADLEAFLAGATILTDAYAPVDRLIGT